MYIYIYICYPALKRKLITQTHARTHNNIQAKRPRKSYYTKNSVFQYMREQTNKKSIYLYMVQSTVKVVEEIVVGKKEREKERK